MDSRFNVNVPQSSCVIPLEEYERLRTIEKDYNEVLDATAYNAPITLATYEPYTWQSKKYYFIRPDDVVKDLGMKVSSLEAEIRRLKNPPIVKPKWYKIW